MSASGTTTATQHPLRVGIACFSTFGGSGVVASEIGLTLASRGHTVHVFSDDRPGRLGETGAGGSTFTASRSAATPSSKAAPTRWG